MRRSLLGILFLMASVGVVPQFATARTAGGTAQGSPPARGAGGWARVWSDDFNGPAGTGVDPSIWTYDTGQGIFGTGEIETMTNSTANVHLTATAISTSRRWGRASRGHRDGFRPSAAALALLW